MTLQAAQMPVASVESFTTCVHCGSDLPSRSTDPFCCSGCRHVYRLLQESGLSRYYDLRGGRRLAPASLPTTRANEPWLEQLLVA